MRGHASNVAHVSTRGQNRLAWGHGGLKHPSIPVTTGAGVRNSETRQVHAAPQAMRSVERLPHGRLHSCPLDTLRPLQDDALPVVVGSVPPARVTRSTPAKSIACATPRVHPHPKLMWSLCACGRAHTAKNKTCRAIFGQRYELDDRHTLHCIEWHCLHSIALPCCSAPRRGLARPP